MPTPPGSRQPARWGMALALFLFTLGACAEPSGDATTRTATVAGALPRGSPAMPTTRPATRVSSSPATCAPTLADDLSPSYKPNAPARSIVGGGGHILTGVVRSARDCAPIGGARIKLWPESPDGGHRDDYRATVFADSDGAYRFECPSPDHIHILVTAAGHRPLATNAYHPRGRGQGTFDLVLVPADR